jgi:hypothetical protein
MNKNILFLLFAITFTFGSCKKDDDNDSVIVEKTYPTSGLISYFNFDDNLKDQVGTTPDGINHDATFVTGKGGKALNMNGNGQYVEFEREDFVSGNSVSVAVWVNVSSEPGNGIYLIMCNDFGIFTTDGLGIAISVPGTNNAKGPFTANTWNHLVGTYDGTNIKAYVNGELVGTTNHPGSLHDTDYKLTIGYFNSGFWHGMIDDLFIYDKVLSQSEVTQLYNYHK